MTIEHTEWCLAQPVGHLDGCSCTCHQEEILEIGQRVLWKGLTGEIKNTADDVVFVYFGISDGQVYADWIPRADVTPKNQVQQDLEDLL